MKLKSFLFFLVFFVILTFSCTSKKENTNLKRIHAITQEIQKKYIPDRRTSRFDAEVIDEAGQLVVKGITTNEPALAEFREKLAATGIPYRDSVLVLPTADLKDKTGVITNSVANIRVVKGDASEMASQALLGTPLKMLQKTGNWYMVQTPDSYIGWIYGSEFSLMDASEFDQWLQKPKLIFTDTYGKSYNNISKEGVVSDLVAGDILAILNESNDFYQIAYPDGRLGYVLKSQSKPYMNWLNDMKTTQETLVETSKQLLGVPYLWGGTSTKSVDCSGFTKTVYFLNGMVIPRDASQQVNEGKLIDDQKDFSKLQPGDLLFFGRISPEGKEKVVHVGMWIGNNEFIHASGNVHISSMDSLAPDYDEANYKRYLRTKRFLQNQTEGIQYLKNRLLYLK
ncbi:MAG: C40 family peptidase [Flavobacteriaceae bacterium]|nr:C40 family peptidase [Flavobacteriaceae bacterium]